MSLSPLHVALGRNHLFWHFQNCVTCLLQWISVSCWCINYYCNSKKNPILLSQLLSGAEFTTGAEFSRMYGKLSLIFPKDTVSWRNSAFSPHNLMRFSPLPLALLWLAKTFPCAAGCFVCALICRDVCELGELVLLAFAALGISYCMRNAMNACRNATNAYRNAAACHEDYRLAAAAVTMEYTWPWKGSEEC